MSESFVVIECRNLMPAREIALGQLSYLEAAFGEGGQERVIESLVRDRLGARSARSRRPASG